MFRDGEGFEVNKGDTFLVILPIMGIVSLMESTTNMPWYESVSFEIVIQKETHKEKKSVYIGQYIDIRTSYSLISV